jgi:hypothetical protein
VSTIATARVANMPDSVPNVVVRSGGGVVRTGAIAAEAGLRDWVLVVESYELPACTIAPRTNGVASMEMVGAVMSRRFGQLVTWVTAFCSIEARETSPAVAIGNEASLKDQPPPTALSGPGSLRTMVESSSTVSGKYVRCGT